MNRLKFLYIGKRLDSESPLVSFKCLELSDKDKSILHPNWDADRIKGEKILYPITDSFDDNKVFIRGIGTKKVKKGREVIVPIFDGSIDNWNNYLSAYGKECMFYSLNGSLLDDADCVNYMSCVEFLSLLQCESIAKYQDYVENIMQIQTAQRKVMEERLNYLSGYCLTSFIDKHLIQPCYKLSLFITSPYLDCLSDDAKLEGFYREYRRHELEEENIELKRNNKEAIWKKIDKEIKDVFPCCMKDRMSFLFGDECARAYEHILNNFKNS